MDEVGDQEWADHQQWVCYVPSSHTQPPLYFPVPRTGKRIRLVASITAHGFLLKHLIVIPRKTYGADLVLTGTAQERVAIHSQRKGYTDRSISLASPTDLFLPGLPRRRYAGNSVLIMDNCTAHTGSEVEEAYAVSGVVAVPLPPHGLNQIQPLDLSTFRITKPAHHALLSVLRHVREMTTLMVPLFEILSKLCASFAQN
jgi:hypothetical protein